MYCYHPGLSPVGSCRICQVEVKQGDTPARVVVACRTPVAEGMIVDTEAPKAHDARRECLEFLLKNHPLDCPICDKAGECDLQDYAFQEGQGEGRSVEPRRKLEKRKSLGDVILLDEERCILCSRCVRFFEEVTEKPQLTVAGLGSRSVIATFADRPLEGNYQGNVADICPVGALTLKEFRFQTRVWYLRNTSTICAGCARGCNVVVGVGQQQTMMTTAGQLDDRIKRIVPRVNTEVNDWWICDEGRLSYLREQGSRRLVASAVSGAAASYDAAVAKAAELLAAAAKAKTLGAIVSPRLVSEDVFAWKTALDALGGAAIHVHELVRGEDDDLLLRADKGANSTGATWIAGKRPAPAAAKTLLVLGDTLDAADNPGVPAGTEIVYVGPFVMGATREAAVAIPAASWSEAGGTFVNFEGRAQRVRRCHLPVGEARPSWRIALDVLAAAGAEAPAWRSEDDVLEALAARVPEFSGITTESLGLLGVPAGGKVGA